MRFHIDHQIPDFKICPCAEWRRISGMFWARFEAPADRPLLNAGQGLRRYASSAWARRESCAHFGSRPFYRLNEEGASYDVAPGAIDGPVSRRMLGHVLVAGKGDYDEITGGLAQRKGSP